jgi:TolB-like protein
VIARNSSFTYKGRSVDIRTVGRELGVQSVLEGSIRRAGKRVRIGRSSSIRPMAATCGPTATTAI